MQEIATKVNSRTFQLVQPLDIEEVNVERNLKEGWVVVQPVMASVCHADTRYFSGQRRKEALAKKLPMALLHEGIGIVKKSLSNKFKVGERVAVVPNIPGYVLNGTKKTSNLPDNYDKNGVFLSSGYDGIAQSDLVQPEQCLVRIPEAVPDEIAVMTEVSTVGYHAASHVQGTLMKPNVRVALFGDGPVGYMAAAVIRYIYGIDASRFTVFGAIKDRLDKFTFARREMVQNYDFEHSDEEYDVIFEATGGHFSSNAINEGIKIISRGGEFVLMGVSEELVPIDTRNVLEKGLTLYGTSRSATEDFKAVVKALGEDEKYREALAKLLPENETFIQSASDLQEAFKKIIEEKKWNKAVLKFEWN
ncbi:alcohol dehydrogenase catalytic domain-containing protein [Sporolactobacillus sp. KGMB 08714]|uniref:alcohol dehydrogenase catalytic domain-containing protein n=1 Tax=Sporolactobacillus sp. KGMB 08714 TaxID=3064704 RepID=UPI002FBE6096